MVKKRKKETVYIEFDYRLQRVVVAVLLFITLFVISTLLFQYVHISIREPWQRMSHNISVNSIKKFLYPSPVAVEPIKVYLVALGDKGAHGTYTGCDDSIVAVSKEIAPEITPLRSALNALFSLKEQYDSESGYYNSLYRSNLEVDHITRSQGRAEVFLKGILEVGGACEKPRLVGQLNATVRAYVDTDEIQIFINRIPLEQITSGK